MVTSALGKINGSGRLLGDREMEVTTAWILARQKPSGEIPWGTEGKMDPWDHIHAAMGLTVMGYRAEARAAFRYLARIQEPNGAWTARRLDGAVTDRTRESNHAAYIATGLWHLYCAQPDAGFLDEMWPVLDSAIELVVSMQEPSGAISWAINPEGRVWRAPLLAGSASIHGSLVCANRIAARLGHDRPSWRRARARLGRVLREDMEVFMNTDLPEKPGRFSMDWYYPVLGGAVRGSAGRRRLLDPSWSRAFVEEGVGCRCVRDQPWYTVAETSELVVALDACGLTNRAREILSWMDWQRTDNGAYWTGMTHPDKVVFPDGEQTTWTAASILLATDAVLGVSATSDFFRNLAGDYRAEIDGVAASATPGVAASGISVAAGKSEQRRRKERERAPAASAVK
jgi:hypothetical protein